MSTPRRPARRSLLGAAASLALAGCSGGSGPDEPDPTGTGASPTSPATTPSPDTTAALSREELQDDWRTEVRYGSHPRQVSDLWLPPGERREALVVLVHGGAWLDEVDRADVLSLVADLVGRGWPVLNADYRGVGGGGGWDSTFTDLATAVDSAAEVAANLRVPPARIAVFGHSAGGHLAGWAAARHRLPAGAPGADPRVRPAFLASASGVLHPTAIGGEGQDPNVTNVFGGTPEEVDERYAVGDPTRLVPLGVPALVVHGTGDTTVTPDQARAFAAAARGAGDEVELVMPEGVGHNDVLDPTGTVWPLVRGRLEEVLA